MSTIAANHPPMLLTLFLLSLQASPGPRDAATVEWYVNRLLHQHSPGIGERYAGSFTVLDDDELRAAFPRHRFLIADIFYSHWAPDDGSVKLLLIQNAASGRIEGYCWAPWYSGHSESFADFLRGYRPDSEKQAVAMVAALARAVAATDTFSVDFVHAGDGEITAPLLNERGMWRLIHVSYDARQGFGRLVLHNPITRENDEAYPFAPQP